MSDHPSLMESCACLLPALLEQQAFVFCDLATAAAAQEVAADEPAIVAEVEFAGAATRGHCRLGAPLSLCREIAANVLGTDPGDAAADQSASDCLKEVANVVTGHVLTTHFGEDSQFVIAAPTVRTALPAEWHAALAEPGTEVYLAASQPVWLLIGFVANASARGGAAGRSHDHG